MKRVFGMKPAELNRFLAAVAVREYLFEHPFTVVWEDDEQVFSDDFRRFVISLCGRGEPCESMPIDEICQVTGVPDELLEEWLCRK